MRRIGRVKVAVVALAMFFAASVQGQALKLVPANALVVVKIKNLSDVSKKVALLSQQWGLANIRPELNDPLGTLLTAANLGPGLNKNGEVVVAVMEPGPGQREPNIVALVPVTDFAAFSKALPNAKEEGELMTFSMGGSPQPGYVANWGEYAAISPQKANVTQKGTGLVLSAVAEKEFASKDVVAYANMKEIRKQALPQIQQFKPMIMQNMEKGIAQMPGGNPKYAPLMKAYFMTIFSIVEGFIRDADGAALGVNLSKDGISTTLLADFQPGSYSGKIVSSMKNGDGSLTAGLPEGKYLFYGGIASNTDPAVRAQVMNDFLAPIEKEAAALGADGKAIMDYLANSKIMFGAMKQMSFGMVAPAPNTVAQEGFVQVVSVVKGDAKTMAEAQKKMLATENEFMKMWGAGDLMKVERKDGVKTVDGVTLDLMTMTMNGQPQTPMEQQMAFMTQMMYGQNGVNAYTGVIGNDKMVSVLSSNEALLNAAVSAAKTDADPLSKGPAAKVTAALPQNRIAGFYVAVDQIATTVFDFMASRNMPVGVKLPPNLPPLAAVVDVEGSAIRVDGYIPSQTVQSLIAAGMQMWLNNMQGGAGQPNGL